MHGQCKATVLDFPPPKFKAQAQSATAHASLATRRLVEIARAHLNY